jgi:hypothetical protein
MRENPQFMRGFRGGKKKFPVIFPVIGKFGFKYLLTRNSFVNYRDPA